MKDALAKGAQAGSAERAVTRDRCADAMTRAERTLAEVLADVLRADRLSVDNHFFEELGADSLVMARFCARVRKRGDLPSVSMKDIYRHPTIRSLAAALADAAPKPVQPPVSVAIEAATSTSAREYILCAALQALCFLAYSYLTVLGVAEGYQWLVAEAEGIERIVRLILFASAIFLIVCAVPIVVKWLLIGRWKPRQVRLWSLDYLRFWIVKTLIRSNPAPYLFVGSPLYGLYLRVLGAKVGPGVVILSRHIPVCTDLLTIGAGTVIRREASFLCYRAGAGRIEIGAVTLGRDVFVGERSVLDINTSMGDGAQLGHASALHSGQAVPAGQRWHGSPAVRADTEYLRVPPTPCGRVRRAASAALTFIGILFVLAPLLEWGLGLLFGEVSKLVEALDPSVRSSGALTVRGLLIEALIFSAVLFFGSALAGLLAAGIVPRVLNVFNDEVSSTSFSVSRAAIGPRNFVGNYVNYPSGGRTGDNVLLGTKVMVPLDGKVREGVGLLGSPPFEIPRSVERDCRFDHLRTGEALRRGLAAKNRFNLRTIGIFLSTRWLGVFLIVLIDLAALELFYDVWAHTVMAVLFALSAVVAAIYYALVERCFEALGPPPPAICSIYDPGFWWVERVWKLHPINFLHLFDGTPFKSVLWRLIGVRFGKRVFDDGVFISEPTLTVIGDECVLNQQSIIQCDSQEDGPYKSGRATLGAGCTIGVGAFG